jgi:Ca2+-binding EF-hand superfamily protein
VNGLCKLEARLIAERSSISQVAHELFREKNQSLVQRLYGKTSLSSMDESSISDTVQRDCPNGDLTRDTFIQIYKQFFPRGRAENFCEHVFRAFDSGRFRFSLLNIDAFVLLDNSGKIDFKEFLQAINITSQGTPDKKLEMAFRMYDCNGDGSIDETEMRRIISVSDKDRCIDADQNNLGHL